MPHRSVGKSLQFASQDQKDTMASHVRPPALKTNTIQARALVRWRWHENKKDGPIMVREYHTIVPGQRRRDSPLRLVVSVGRGPRECLIAPGTSIWQLIFVRILLETNSRSLQPHDSVCQVSLRLLFP